LGIGRLAGIPIPLELAGIGGLDVAVRILQGLPVLFRLGLAWPKQFHIVKAQAITTAGRIELQIESIPVIAEIGGVAQPKGFAVRTDELAGKVQKYACSPKCLR
jgi:hypothetical protein